MEVLTMFRNRRRGVRSPRLTRNVSTPKRPRRRGNTLSKIATPPARAARNASLTRKVLDRARRTPPSVARRARRKISPTQLRNVSNQYREFAKRSRAASKGRRPLKKIQRNTKAFLSNFARRRRR
tara:strand:- start:92 stop:466 length:375 start_codon:yes stop_codon:yes gene_type:complete